MINQKTCSLNSFFRSLYADAVGDTKSHQIKWTLHCNAIWWRYPVPSNRIQCTIPHKTRTHKNNNTHITRDSFVLCLWLCDLEAIALQVVSHQRNIPIAKCDTNYIAYRLYIVECVQRFNRNWENLVMHGTEVVATTKMPTTIWFVAKYSVISNAAHRFRLSTLQSGIISLGSFPLEFYVHEHSYLSRRRSRKLCSIMRDVAFLTIISRPQWAVQLK